MLPATAHDENGAGAQAPRLHPLYKAAPHGATAGKAPMQQPLMAQRAEQPPKLEHLLQPLAQASQLHTPPHLPRHNAPATASPARHISPAGSPSAPLQRAQHHGGFADGRSSPLQAIALTPPPAQTRRTDGARLRSDGPGALRARAQQGCGSGHLASAATGEFAIGPLQASAVAMHSSQRLQTLGTAPSAPLGSPSPDRARPRRETGQAQAARMQSLKEANGAPGGAAMPVADQGRRTLARPPPDRPATAGQLETLAAGAESGVAAVRSARGGVVRGARRALGPELDAAAEAPRVTVAAPPEHLRRADTRSHSGTIRAVARSRSCSSSLRSGADRSASHHSSQHAPSFGVWDAQARPPQRGGGAAPQQPQQNVSLQGLMGAAPPVASPAALPAQRNTDAEAAVLTPVSATAPYHSARLAGVQQPSAPLLADAAAVPPPPHLAASAPLPRTPPPADAPPPAALRLHCVTWNVGRMKLGPELAGQIAPEFFGFPGDPGDSDTPRPDVLVIGTQESASAAAWVEFLQVLLQPLGYDMATGGAAAQSAPGGSFFMTAACFVRRPLRRHVSDVQVGRVSCGLGNKARPLFPR